MKKDLKTYEVLVQQRQYSMKRISVDAKSIDEAWEAALQAAEKGDVVFTDRDTEYCEHEAIEITPIKTDCPYKIGYLIMAKPDFEDRWRGPFKIAGFIHPDHFTIDWAGDRVELSIDQVRFMTDYELQEYEFMMNAQECGSVGYANKCRACGGQRDQEESVICLSCHAKGYRLRIKSTGKTVVDTTIPFANQLSHPDPNYSDPAEDKADPNDITIPDFEIGAADIPHPKDAPLGIMLDDHEAYWMNKGECPVCKNGQVPISIPGGGFKCEKCNWIA